MSAFRPDRFVSVSMIRPLMGLRRSGGQCRVPILMYHGIREEKERDSPYFRTATSPRTFRLHLRVLKEQGYSTVTLSRAVEILRSGDSTKKHVAITVDDGCHDFFSHALPILLEFGFTATLFVVSGFASRAISPPCRFAAEQFMTWEEVREAQRGGVEIGSHTNSHPKLHLLSKADLTYELKHSKEAIEDQIQGCVESFSHPFAFPEQDKRYVLRFAGLLDSLGYKQGVTTIIGTAAQRSPTYLLPRLPINDLDDEALLRAKLECAYDWLRIPQRLYKTLVKRERAGSSATVSDTRCQAVGD